MNGEAFPAMDFAKYEALGNDYVVIDPSSTGFVPLPEHVRLACDRHHGLGGDGLLYGPLPAGEGFGLLTFNPDGSECPQSGNGLRIFARYLRDSGHTGADAFTLHSPAGPSAVRVLDLASGTVSADLGVASLDSRAVGAAGPARPLLRERLSVAGERFEVTCVQLGGPHCVIPVPDRRADETLARTVGAAVRDHAMFPGRINVELLEVIDRETLRIEIFERGAGYTLASGSSACAAAVAAHALNLTGARVTVRMPGGEVEVGIGEDGRVTLTGVVRPVLRGHWAPGIGQRLSEGALA